MCLVPMGLGADLLTTSGISAEEVGCGEEVRGVVEAAELVFFAGLAGAWFISSDFWGWVRATDVGRGFRFGFVLRGGSCGWDGL